MKNDAKTTDIQVDLAGNDPDYYCDGCGIPCCGSPNYSGKSWRTYCPECISEINSGEMKEDEDD